MAVYRFECEEHGIFELEQRMSEEHKGLCSRCKRIYTVPALAGDLPTTNFITSKDKPYFYKDLKDEGVF